MTRRSYRALRSIATRWIDNDSYGHVNNIIYYSWFDTAVNMTLIEAGLLDIDGGSIIGLVVESGCQYHRSVAFPQTVEAGLRIGRLGSSSVRWDIGIFTDDDENPAATGHLVHVFVDRARRRPIELPAQWRDRLASLVAATAD